MTSLESNPQNSASGQPDGGDGMSLGGAKAEGAATKSGAHTHDIDDKVLRRARIVTFDHARTRANEEFRLIKRSVLHTVDKIKKDGGANSNLVMVTSSRDNEGKTFVAMNLAFSIACERDTNVILVDADLTKSAVSMHLEIDREEGFSDLLDRKELSISDALIETNIEGFSILPAGPQHPFSTELLASERMNSIAKEVSKAYPDCIVIFDAPPVLATSEAAALAAHMGQVVFVVEAEKTSRFSITESLHLINQCPRIGFVFNKARFQFGSVRFGSYYKSYYKSYTKSYRRSPRS